MLKIKKTYILFIISFIENDSFSHQGRNNEISSRENTNTRKGTRRGYSTTRKKYL